MFELFGMYPKILEHENEIQKINTLWQDNDAFESKWIN